MDENLVERHIRYPNLTCFAFLLRGFISGKRVPVYPVWGVFLVEIRGKNEELYALEATKLSIIERTVLFLGSGHRGKL